jgi:hypothetical protein
LGQLADLDGVEVEAVCARCGESLGRYWAGQHDPGDPVSLVGVRGGMSKFMSIHPVPGVKKLLGRRTQRGLRVETWGEAEYVRKYCTCPANEKRCIYPGRGLDDMPVTIRPDGTIVLAF